LKQHWGKLRILDTFIKAKEVAAETKMVRLEAATKKAKAPKKAKKIKHDYSFLDKTLEQFALQAKFIGMKGKHNEKKIIGMKEKYKAERQQ
jgi:hypothetical protein